MSIETGQNADPADLSYIVPVGTVLPFAGASAPTGYLLCNGAAVSRTTYAALFAAIGELYGAGDGSTTFNLPNVVGRMPVGAGQLSVVFTVASRASNVITVTGASDIEDNELQTGQAVHYSAASGAMTGLTHDTTYYLIRQSNSSFALASSRAEALAGTAIALSSNGSGTQTFTLTGVDRDLGVRGGEEKHAVTVGEMPSHRHRRNEPASSSSSGSGYLQPQGISGSNGYQDGAPFLENTGGSGNHNNMPPFIAFNWIIRYLVYS